MCVCKNQKREHCAIRIMLFLLLSHVHKKLPITFWLKTSKAAAASVARTKYHYMTPKGWTYLEWEVGWWWLVKSYRERKSKHFHCWNGGHGGVDVWGCVLWYGTSAHTRWWRVLINFTKSYKYSNIPRMCCSHLQFLSLYSSSLR